jgi:peptide/nickel transport system ATP-binding protein
MTDHLLQVQNLRTEFATDQGVVTAVEDVSFSLKAGETVGLVGESGSGKSVTALSIMRLLKENGRVTGGSVTFDGKDLLGMSAAEMRRIRGNEISMIFQEPMTSLNPVLKIGDQLAETMILHLGMSKADAWKRAVELLDHVGIPRPAQIAADYPHRLSGGMRQRAMIAMALSCKPKLIIADEPTTALDVTIQAQILRLMRQLGKESNTAMILITHDLGVVAEMADRVVVMYAGQVVEEADVYNLFDDPKHPYTVGLMGSIPQISSPPGDRLQSIPGSVPSLLAMPEGCRFADRCASVMPHSRTTAVELKVLDEASGHSVRCLLYEPGGPRSSGTATQSGQPLGGVS